jgi:catalase
MLAKLPAAKQFAADAFAHLKFIGYTKAALLLFQKAGIAEDLDEGCIELTDVKSVKAFVSSCRQLRLWERERRPWRSDINGGTPRRRRRC